MDCLCCTDAGNTKSSDKEFLGSICNPSLVPNAVFPAEANRYSLYIVAGCPFAARPWSVAAFYGLADSAIRIVKAFPASHDSGWFFQPVSDGEHDLVAAFPEAQFDKQDPHHGKEVTHLKQLYEMAKPGFTGAISVPLLWDTVKDTAVSNSSMDLAEMIATQMKHLGSRNQNICLFPDRTAESDLYLEHDALVKMLHADVTTAVYKMNGTTNGREHDKLVDAYYRVLDELQTRITTNGPFLMGESIRFADLVLFISLIRLDLAYQWRFGLGRRSVRESYPGLFGYMNRILHLPGMAESVLPRDIMALYFMTLKWVQPPAGRTLPQVPESWEVACGLGSASTMTND